MKIVDTLPYFLSDFQPQLCFLREYYEEYPDIFSEYFAYHCKDTDERLANSIEKYASTIPTIKQVHKNIIPIIKDITNQYNRIYQVSFPIEVNLIVGGFGSNAYTHRQIIPNITFALEKLSPVPEHLKTIVAHEFGHAAQNILSNNSGMDWSKVNWNSPLTWLNQEGTAIHFTRKTVRNLYPSVYFHFNDEGQDWLTFAKANSENIKLEFAKDFFAETSTELFREWFSINGGKKFGHSRLGYFLGDLFFQNQIKALGETKAIIAWKESNFKEQVKNWLLDKNISMNK